MKKGDVVIALGSSGIHSNGYSLVRKVFDIESADLDKYYEELGGTLGEALLKPTRIYVKQVLKAVDGCAVHGISHITGGGFYENIPRSVPDGRSSAPRRRSPSRAQRWTRGSEGENAALRGPSNRQGCSGPAGRRTR